MFLLALRLRQSLHYSPADAGDAMPPVTVLMLLAPRTGALAQRTGPRLPMTGGNACWAAQHRQQGRQHR